PDENRAPVLAFGRLRFHRKNLFDGGPQLAVAFQAFERLGFRESRGPKVPVHSIRLKLDLDGEASIPKPVLIRQGAPFAEWASGGRPARGFERGPASLASTSIRTRRALRHGLTHPARPCPRAPREADR